MTDPFIPVPPDGNWRNNAVGDFVREMGDAAIAAGYRRAAELLVEHWGAGYPDDTLFLPIVFNYRHALELVLKVTIREAAACLRADGAQDADLQPAQLDDWLASPRGAGHDLQVLGHRADNLLQRLRISGLPATTHEILHSLHQLDPKGDSFRYATSRQGGRQFGPAPRPSASHIDVVSMGKHFDDTFSLLFYGVLSVIGEYRDLQASMV